MTVTTPTIEQLSERLGLPWQAHQEGALTDAAEQVARGTSLRLCLYHATGKGKTYTSLASIALTGVREVLVLAPPITHPRWVEAGRLLGMEVTAISHAKWRQKTFKIRRTQPIIVDEFHLLGGQDGVGWKKLDRIAPGLQAPLVIASATPNYNDVERVYCVQHVLAPDTVRGGYIEFLYTHCVTRQNPFGKMPNVEGFKDGRSAEEHLADLPYVHYVEDEVIKQVSIGDVPVDTWGAVPDEFEEFGLDRRRGRICASQMEERHARKRHLYLDDDGELRPEVYEAISVLAGQVSTPSLVYSDSETIASAIHRAALEHGASSLLVTGKTSPKKKAAIAEQFIAGGFDVLIGTATMATGLDGVDKMCDQLIIVDDTTDDSLRRQLMGRILPRGLDSDASGKVFARLVLS